MYVPEPFVESDENAVKQVIQSAPLACIVANTAQGLIANHIPLTFDRNGSLIGHVAMNNDMHRLIEADTEVLAIFRASDAYISPNDYPTKQTHHMHVPTWNYQVVHVYGTIRFFHDKKTKQAAVGLLTHLNEREVNGPSAWRMADAPSHFLEDKLENIVAFKLTPTRIIGKSKLSQNRELVDVKGAIAGTKNRGKIVIASKMEDALQKR